MGSKDAVTATVDRSEEADSWIGRGVETGDVLGGVRRVADDREGQVGRHPGICVDHDVGVVLGLEPADVEDVAPGLQADAC
jgi:hypothetical protein